MAARVCLLWFASVFTNASSDLSAFAFARLGGSVLNQLCSFTSFVSTEPLTTRRTNVGGEGSFWVLSRFWQLKKTYMGVRPVKCERDGPLSPGLCPSLDDGRYPTRESSGELSPRRAVGRRRAERRRRPHVDVPHQPRAGGLHGALPRSRRERLTRIITQHKSLAEVNDLLELLGRVRPHDLLRRESAERQVLLLDVVEPRQARRQFMSVVRADD